MKARTKRKQGVPLSRANVKRAVYDATKLASVNSQNEGWILFLAAVVEEDSSMGGARADELFKQILAMANTQKKAHELTSVLTREQNEIGFYMPHPHITIDNIKTKYDLDVAIKKIQRNSLYSAVGVLCAGLLSVDGYTMARVRNVFMIADLIDAEIVTGRNSIDIVARGLEQSGTTVVRELWSCNELGVEAS